MTKNDKELENALHVGTIHRKGEPFVNEPLRDRYFRQILRLGDVPCENAEQNLLYIYNHGAVSTYNYENEVHRQELYNMVQAVLDELDFSDEVGNRLVHDEFFYAVYESEKDDLGMKLDDVVLHTSLVDSIIQQSTKEKEHDIVLYFTQMDSIDENNMYVIRSVCVERAIFGNAW